MKFGVVKRNDLGALSFDDSVEEEVRTFCNKNRNVNNSQCEAHYRKIFANPAGQTNPGTVVECPYGLHTTGAIPIGNRHVVLNGIYVEQRSGKTQAAPPFASRLESKRADVDRLISFLREVEQETRNVELDHLETALHDARHLNHAITQTSEVLLGRSGYPAGSNWDMKALQSDEEASKLLTIFAASRDLADAILMHEISRDPTQAARDQAVVRLHKIFYRQFQISHEGLTKKGLRWKLGPTDMPLKLSGYFRLIPKILIDNAVKFADRSSEIRVNFIEGQSTFSIECINEGATVKQEEISKLFQRGTRGSNRGDTKGHGLGLWLAKIIVEANNGAIRMSVGNERRDISGRRIGTTEVHIRLLK